jgi:hypothetical protein
MRIPKKNLWIIFGLAVFLVVLFELLNWIHQEVEIRFFHDALAQVVVAPIQIGTHMYRLEQGTIYVGDSTVQAPPPVALEGLRIAYYLVLSRRDPYFSLDGTDPNSMRSAIESVQITTGELAKKYPADVAEKIEKALYPFNLLSSLADLQSTRDEFLTAPSEENFLAYRKALQKIQPEYQKAVIALRDAISGTVENGTDYVFADGYATGNSFRGALQQLTQLSQATKAGIAARERCMNGDTSSCPALAFSPKLAVHKGARITATPSLTSAAISNRALLNTAYGITDPSKMTVVFLSKSDCLPSSNPAYETYVHGSDGSGGFTYIPLNDVYFWEVPAAHGGGSPSYLFQPVSNPYVCSAGADDMVRIASMREIRSILEKKPIIGMQQGSVSEEIRAARTLEARIANASHTLSENDVEAYTGYLNDLLTSYSEEKFAILFGGDAPARAETLLSAWKSRTGYFDQVLASVSRFNEASASQVNVANTLQPEYLFVSRSMPRLMLLAFNPSVVQQNISFVEHGNFSSFVKLLSYDTILSFSMSRDQVLRMITNSLPHIPETPVH